MYFVIVVFSCFFFPGWSVHISTTWTPTRYNSYKWGEITPIRAIYRSYFTPHLELAKRAHPMYNKNPSANNTPSLSLVFQFQNAFWDLVFLGSQKKPPHVWSDKVNQAAWDLLGKKYSPKRWGSMVMIYHGIESVKNMTLNKHKRKSGVLVIQPLIGIDS